MGKAETGAGGTTAVLTRLLEAERQALLAGELEALPALVAEKERLLAAVESGAAPDAATLEALRAAALANQALLKAALRGVRAARARLDMLRNGGPALSTYTSSGRAETHTKAGPTVERRA